MSERAHFTLRIEGMTCAGCARHVTQALKSVSGVESVEIGDWQVGTAAVVASAAVVRIWPRLWRTPGIGPWSRPGERLSPSARFPRRKARTLT